MSNFETIRLILGGILLLGGLFCLVTAVIGNYRFKDVTQRMHAAGVGDTFGVLLLFAGITVLCGISSFTVKMTVVLALMWISGPTLSHLIMKLEWKSNTEHTGKMQEGDRQ